MTQRWTKKEIDLLKNLYPKVRVKYLVNQFPDRNADTIVVKALSLGLPSAKIWQFKENEILKKHFAIASREELLILLPKRTWSAIRAQGERLHLKRKTNKPKLEVNERYFCRWTTNMAYILGFILADGCIIKGTYKGYSDSLKFGVQLRDLDILEKIKKELKAKHKISKVRSAVYLSIASQIMVNDLKKLNISYRKSLREKIPDVQPKYIRDFIRGIIDGDGSISIDNKNYPSLSLCGGKNTTAFVRDYFFDKFRIYSKVSERPSKLGGLYEICYRCNPAMKLLDYLYTGAEIYLNRKYDLAMKCLKMDIKCRRNRYGFSSS